MAQSAVVTALMAKRGQFLLAVVAMSQLNGRAL